MKRATDDDLAFIVFRAEGNDTAVSFMPAAIIKDSLEYRMAVELFLLREANQYRIYLTNEQIEFTCNELIKSVETGILP